jgi:hypothetical protein
MTQINDVIDEAYKGILQLYMENLWNISWSEYVQRFEGTHPLKLNFGNSLEEHEPIEVQANFNTIFENTSSYAKIRRFNKDVKLICGFKHKVERESFENLNYIRPNVTGLGYLFHERIIDKMIKIAGDDFEPVPITLININKTVKPFEITHFYDINPLKKISAVDEENSEISIGEKTKTHSIDKLVYKEDPWREGYELTGTGTNPVKYRE